MRSLRAFVMAAQYVGVWCAMCVVPIATTARAEAGVKLSWDHCSGDGHVSLGQFACDTDEGRDVIVGSFVAPAGVGDFVLTGMPVYPPVDRISWQAETTFCSGAIVNPVRNTTWGSVKVLFR